MKGTLRSWTFVAVLATGALVAPATVGTAPPAGSGTPSARNATVVPTRPPAVAPPAALLSTGGAQGETGRAPRPAADTEPRPAPEPPPEPSPDPYLLVEVPRDLTMTSRPGAGRTIGAVPDGSRFYDVPTVAWVEEVTPDGRFGRLSVPYRAGHDDGWIRLNRLRRDTTWVHVEVDLSERRVTVFKRDRVVFRTRGAVGAPASPTPTGRYFVTDRIPFSAGSSLGHFAFGISGIQPRLPAGWTGGDQLAIHGTNDPSSIGAAASAGCVRVSASALERLKPLLRLGTPVQIER